MGRGHGAIVFIQKLSDTFVGLTAQTEHTYMLDHKDCTAGLPLIKLVKRQLAAAWNDLW